MGGKLAKSPARAYTKRLDEVEATLATATDADALGKLSLEAHMINYELGRDMRAIIALPAIVDRATAVKVRTNEHAARAYEAVGNVRKAAHHLFDAMEAWPSLAELVRLLGAVATLLAGHVPEASARMRDFLAELPAGDAGRDAFRGLHRLKYSFDWNALPVGA